MHCQPSSWRLGFSILSTTSRIHYMRMSVGLSSRSINCYSPLCLLLTSSSENRNLASIFGDFSLPARAQIQVTSPTPPIGSLTVLGLTCSVTWSPCNKATNSKQFTKTSCPRLTSSNESSIPKSLTSSNYQVHGISSWTSSKNYWC